MESNTQLIANRTALADAWKRTKLENIALLLKAAIEAQGRVGLMLNVRRADLADDPGAAARAAAADDLGAERRGVGGGEHDHRGADGARPDSEAEGGAARRASSSIRSTRSCSDGRRRQPIAPQRGTDNGYEDHRRDQSTGARAACWRATASADRAFERRVAAIVDRVRAGGDRALLRFARRFDGVRPPLEVVARRDAAPRPRVPADVRRAIRAGGAQHRARRVPADPEALDLDVAPGVSVEQRVEPLARVGCYVPGGRFPLPSSLLMTAVPARVAGVREIIAVCPRPGAGVMAAALEAGVTRLFRVGGAHAIAALAYGTATIPRVDKIVGPGNRYVAAAKALRLGRLRDRLLRRADRDRDRRRHRAGRSGSPPISSRRPSTIPTRGRSSSPGAGALAARVAAAVARPRRRAATSCSSSLAAHGAIDRHPDRPTKRWRWPTASRPSIWSSIARR